MLAVSIKLNHIVISMINRITRSRLKPNSQSAINGHINNVTTKVLADSQCSISRPIIDDYKIKLRCNLPEFAYGISNAILFVVSGYSNKSSSCIRQNKPFSSLYFLLLYQASQKQPPNIQAVTQAQVKGSETAIGDERLFRQANFVYTFQNETPWTSNYLQRSSRATIDVHERKFLFYMNKDVLIVF